MPVTSNQPERARDDPTGFEKDTRQEQSCLSEPCSDWCSKEHVEELMFVSSENVEVQIDDTGNSGTASSVVLNLVVLANSAIASDLKKRKSEWRNICELGFPELIVWDLPEAPASI